MKTTDDFIFELGTEELPPKTLNALGQNFSDRVAKHLAQHQLTHQGIDVFTTPRRLALFIKQLSQQQPDQTIEKKGPAIKAAFDDQQQPTKAALGFAQSCGVNLSELDRLNTPQGSWLLFKQKRAGLPAEQLLPDILTKSLQQLPIAKRMRWGNHVESFIRPIRWILALLGENVIPITLWGKSSDRFTYGHRVHAPDALRCQQASDYAALLLKQGHVIADPIARRASIETQLHTAAQQQNATLIAPETLLNEVSGLVEWPLVLTGTFDPAFLDIPQEALISAMQGHQKYFPLVDAQQKLLPYFLLVSNLNSRAPERVIQGNEKVIRPRFNDAQFFYQQDQKKPLHAFNESLRSIVYHPKLGSLYDKVQRTQRLTLYFAEQLKANTPIAHRAAELCKADLATLMVQEFPELQGVMGRYYARLSQESDAVAQAIQEHYAPLNMEAANPSSLEATCVALADKLDTLVSIFSTGQIPSGDKDPFALRRAASGILKILIEGEHPLNVEAAVETSIRLLSDNAASPLKADLAPKLLNFIRARLPAFYPNIATETQTAVFSLPIHDPFDLHLRLTALAAFKGSEALYSLSIANKRVNNLLKKSGINTPITLAANTLCAPEEITLHNTLLELHPKIKTLCAKQAYQAALEALSHLRFPVDHFFDAVHIMVEDQHLRHQRLALLSQLQALFITVADITQLTTEPAS